jgi:hypothetical protein
MYFFLEIKVKTSQLLFETYENLCLYLFTYLLITPCFLSAGHFLSETLSTNYLSISIFTSTSVPLSIYHLSYLAECCRIEVKVRVVCLEEQGNNLLE